VASFLINCTLPDGGGGGGDNDTNRTDTIKPGDFCTYTQGGYGSTCPHPGECSANAWNVSSAQPGCLRDCHLVTAFPTNIITLGLIGPFRATFQPAPFAIPTLAFAIARYLPQGGPPSNYNAILVNPLSTAAGVLGGQLLTAVMNYNFSLAFGNASNMTHLRYAHNCTLVHSFFYNRTLADIIYIANVIISQTYPGNVALLPPPLSTDLLNAFPTAASLFSSFNQALTIYNEEFDGCDIVATNCFTLH
jgi:hypothetical protein